MNDPLVCGTPETDFLRVCYFSENSSTAAYISVVQYCSKWKKHENEKKKKNNNNRKDNSRKNYLRYTDFAHGVYPLNKVLKLKTLY